MTFCGPLVHGVDHVDERGVDRVLGRGDHRDRGAVVLVALVLELGAGDVDGAVALEGVVEGEAVADRGHVRGGLHRRAGHAAGDRPVDLGLEVVLAPVEAEELAGLGVHGRGADVQVLVAGRSGHPRVRALLVDGRLDVGHDLRVEGRGDPQAATVDLVLGGDAAGQDLLLDQRQHVALLAAELALGRDLGELGQPLEGLVALLGGDAAEVGHAVEDVGIAALEVLAGLLAVGRVVLRRVVEHRRQHRRLPEAELARRVVEERLGRCLDAVGAAAEVDGVEVALEDLLLVQLLLDLERDDRFLDLALVALLARQVEDLDVLLGDRRGTLAVVAAGVGEQCAQDALGSMPLSVQKDWFSAATTASLHRLRHLASGIDSRFWSS